MQRVAAVGGDGVGCRLNYDHDGLVRAEGTRGVQGQPACKPVADGLGAKPTVDLLATSCKQDVYGMHTHRARHGEELTVAHSDCVRVLQPECQKDVMCIGVGAGVSMDAGVEVGLPSPHSLADCAAPSDLSHAGGIVSTRRSRTSAPCLSAQPSGGVNGVLSTAPGPSASIAPRSSASEGAPVAAVNGN